MLEMMVYAGVVLVVWKMGMMVYFHNAK